MDTSTPTPTATPTESATPGVTSTPALYVYSTLAASGQPAAIVYTVTAGEAGIMGLDLAILCVLLFMVFLMVVRRD